MNKRVGWLLLDVIEPREMTVVMIGSKVKPAVPWRSVITQNQQRLMDAVLECCRQKSTVCVDISDSRRITAVPVLERIHNRVHGVWVCTHRSDQPATAPMPSWTFLWDLQSGRTFRGTAVGMVSSWEQLGVPVQRPIADALRVFDLGDQSTTVLAALVRKSGDSLRRYTVVERRPDSERLVHFVVHASPSPSPDTKDTPQETRFLRGLSVDVGRATASHKSKCPTIGDRVAEALTPHRQYLAIFDPDSLNLLFWHGPPAPRIAWSRESTANRPVLHLDDLSGAVETVAKLRAGGPGRSIKLTVRFLTTADEYEPFELSASLINLGPDAHALLVALTV